VAADPTTEAAGRPPASTAPAWVTVSRAPSAAPPDTEVRPRRVLIQLVVGTLAVLVVVGLLGSLAARRLAEREAVNDAATTADVLAEAVIQPAVTDALLTGDPAAVRALDAVVRERVLGPAVVRVKLWDTEGRVLYADEPALVGRTFALTPDQRAVLRSPRTQAEVSDLSQSENEFETGDRLLEVYRPVWTPSGSELLFEMYAPYESVGQRAGQLARGFAGVTLSSLLLLVILVAPILWHLTQRLRRAQAQRELLLARAVDASDQERRRIAASLHDGPVQELAATSFAVAGAAAHAERVDQGQLADDLRRASSGVRSSIRALRSLLVDIYPPGLASAGLPAALADLAQNVRDRDVVVQLDLPAPDAVRLGPEQERLVFRVVQECLRNAVKHAAPCTLTVSLHHEEAGSVLDVVDDGPGFDVRAVTSAPDPGHLGLQVMADAASAAGAVLQVASGSGSGTHWRLVLPEQEEDA
jgi:two-component system, NarL family, sensor kinase